MVVSNTFCNFHPENWDSMIPTLMSAHIFQMGLVVKNHQQSLRIFINMKVSSHRRDLRKPDRLTHDDYVRELEARLQARIWTGNDGDAVYTP